MGVDQATRGDPLAPFAMQAGKCYLSARTARRRSPTGPVSGYAVVSGDPVGDEAQFRELIADFAAMCHTHGWRIVVLACSERRLRPVERPDGAGHNRCGRYRSAATSSSMWPISTMVGRKFRNLRQAVQRTHNCGSRPRSSPSRTSTTGNWLSWPRWCGRHPGEPTLDRGFCMSLDGVLEGRFPGYS